MPGAFSLPPPFVRDLYDRYGSGRIIDLMLRRGADEAEGHTRSGAIWGQTIGNLGNVLGQGVGEALEARKKQKEEGLVGEAVTSAVKAREVAGKATEQGVPNAGGYDLTPILQGVPPELRGRVLKGISDADDAASRIEERKTRIQQETAKLVQDGNDYAGITAYHAAQMMDQLPPEHVLEPVKVALAHASARRIPGSERYHQVLLEDVQRMEQARTGGDPAAMQSLAAEFKKKYQGMAQMMMLGMSPAARTKLLDEETSAVVVPEGGTLVSKRTGAPIATGQPKPKKVGDEESYIRQLYGENPTPQQLLQARRQWAEAGHVNEPDVAPNLSPAGMDMAAEMFAKTFQLPPMGLGRAGSNVRQAIINRAAELHPETNLALEEASYRADSSALAKLQNQRAAVSAFENTALKNIDVFLDTAGKVVDTGSPLANTLVRQANAKLLGSPNQSAYDAARQVAINEVAKVTSNPNLSSVLSDTARKEVENFNPQNATLAQSVAVMRILKKDMQNRTDAIDTQIVAIKRRIATPAGQSAREDTEASQDNTVPEISTRQQFDTLPNGKVFSRGGKRYRKNGSNADPL